MKPANLKLCVGASSGGHMTELDALLEESSSWPIEPSVYISTLSITKTERGKASHRIGECDRSTPLKILKVLINSLFVVAKEQPDVVVTTGSLPLAIFSLIAKAFGAKIIWIDSISQIDKISMSGKLVKPFANKFFVQWPELAERYPKAIYHGELI